MVISVLRKGIFSTNYFIELLDGFLVGLYPIKGVAQLVVIGIVPLPAFAFVL